MAAILRNVAKTDTLEKQRLTINLIANDLFALSSGGAAQNFASISLSNGTLANPSLSFISDNKLGLYKKDINTLGIVSNDNNVISFKDSEILSFTNFYFKKYFIENDNIFIASKGSNYDPGIYTSVPLIGGSGTLAQATVTVIDYEGNITNVGSGYINGTYTSQRLRTISGSGSDVRASFTISGGSIVSPITITSYGTGYTVGSVLGLFTAATSLTTLDSGSNLITVDDTSDIVTGSIVTSSVLDTIPEGTTVSSIIDSTTIELSQNPLSSEEVTLTFTPPYGSGANFSYTITNVGVVSSVNITNGGNGYETNDVLSVVDSALSLPIEYTAESVSVQLISFTSSIPASSINVGDTLELLSGGQPVEVYQKSTQNSNISFILVENGGFSAGDVLVKTGTTTPTFTILTVSDQYIFSIDTGSGSTIAPNLTLFSGNKYVITYPENHPFYLSQTPDGIHAGGSEYVSTNIIRNTTQYTLTILVDDNFPSTLYYYCQNHPGMGGIPTQESVITVDYNNPSPPGTGLEILLEQVSEQDTISADIITGELKSLELDTNILTSSNATISNLSSTSLSSTSINTTTINGQGSGLTLSTSGTTNITVNPGGSFRIGSTITATSSTGNITTTGILKSTNSFNSNDVLTITNSTIESLGTSDIILKPVTERNVKVSSNKSLIIPVGTTEQRPSGVLAETGAIRFNLDTSQYEGYNSSASAWSSLGGVRDIDGNTYIVAEEFTGANDNTLWFYNGGSNSLRITSSEVNLRTAHTISSTDFSGLILWSSNTLYELEDLVYYNDNVYEVTVAGASDSNFPVHTEGAVLSSEPAAGSIGSVSVSNLSSGNSSGIYNVNGSTSGSGNGASFSISIDETGTLNSIKITSIGSGYSINDTILILGSDVGGSDGLDDIVVTVVSLATAVELTWIKKTYGDISFNNVSNVFVRNSPLIIQNQNNNTSITINNTRIDSSSSLTLGVFEGSNVIIDAVTSLALPSGDTSQRGTPTTGSVRYNTESNQYEGYNISSGTWASLGGVRDVDGNTYIIPELSAGSNENILYFYNDDLNTLQVRKSDLNFTNIDTITSDSNNLNLDVQSILLDSSSFGIDTSNGTSSLVFSSLSNLDFGLSVGLSVDTVLRLSSSGEILLNKTFGSGTFTGVKFLDAQLKTFELDDIQIQTNEILLKKGTTDFSSFVVYSPSTVSSSTISITAVNQNTNDIHFEQHSIIVKGSDIYNVEYGTNKSSTLYSVSFDFNPSGNVRATVTLDSSVNESDDIIITAVKTNTKK